MTSFFSVNESECEIYVWNETTNEDSQNSKSEISLTWKIKFKLRRRISSSRRHSWKRNEAHKAWIAMHTWWWRNNLTIWWLRTRPDELKFVLYARTCADPTYHKEIYHVIQLLLTGIYWTQWQRHLLNKIIRRRRTRVETVETSKARKCTWTNLYKRHTFTCLNKEVHAYICMYISDKDRERINKLETSTPNWFEFTSKCTFVIMTRT